MKFAQPKLHLERRTKRKNLRLDHFVHPESEDQEEKIKKVLVFQHVPKKHASQGPTVVKLVTISKFKKEYFYRKLYQEIEMKFAQPK